LEHLVIRFCYRL